MENHLCTYQIQSHPSCCSRGCGPFFCHFPPISKQLRHQRWRRRKQRQPPKLACRSCPPDSVTHRQNPPLSQRRKYLKTITITRTTRAILATTTTTAVTPIPTEINRRIRATNRRTKEETRGNRTAWIIPSIDLRYCLAFIITHDRRLGEYPSLLGLG